MITVVGSIAFDAVRTPAGARERMLGGATTHFALAASQFDRVAVVGPVGGDFGAADEAVLATRGTDLGGLVRVHSGETFFWRGEYGSDLNSRRTLETRLNVFAGFDPVLSPEARTCDALFLANIQPRLQRAVLDQCPETAFVALDSMDLWIEQGRDALLDVIADVDCVIQRVVDPTGAGHAFAGGFVGALARYADLRLAMAYGTALASFNVEAFGTERVVGLEEHEIRARVHDLQAACSPWGSHASAGARLAARSRAATKGGAA